jgi:hypothetical protein
LRGQAGDFAGAAAACNELLADYVRLLGPDHPDTGYRQHRRRRLPVPACHDLLITLSVVA